MTNRDKLLVDVLEKTYFNLSENDNFHVDGLSPAEVSMDLKTNIERLKKGRPVNIKYLKFLFAPTGFIQEHSIINRWQEEYLELSKEFDDIVKDRDLNKWSDRFIIVVVIVLIGFTILSILYNTWTITFGKAYFGG